jgi:hypothetical protein
MGKIEKLATWLDHGKTVFDILVALGGGRLFGLVNHVHENSCTMDNADLASS